MYVKERASLVVLGLHVVTLDSDAATLLSVRPLSVEVFWEERRRAALAVARRLLLERLHVSEDDCRASR